MHIGFKVLLTVVYCDSLAHSSHKLAQHTIAATNLHSDRGLKYALTFSNVIYVEIPGRCRNLCV